MILIIGGAFQGQTGYAKENYEKADGRIFYLNEWARKLFEAAYADGTRQDKIITDILETFKNIIDDRPDLIIITDEIGRGIVPAEKKEREFREIVGRLQIRLARKADEVICVICGIGQRLK